MITLNPAAHSLLARQHGVASLDDLAEAGVDPWKVGALVKAGWLRQVIPGAWKLSSTPDSEAQRCSAVCRAHPEVAIVGPAAGRLFGLRRLPNDLRIHVVAPPASNPTIHPWVVPFRTTAWSAGDIVDHGDGIRTFSRTRLALDLARFVNDDSLLSIIEQCMNDGGHDASEMLAVAVDWISPRRRWVRRYLDALDRRIDGPAAESHLEVVLGDRLRAAGVIGIVRQHRIEVAGHGAIRFDLAVPDSKWAVEVDGFPTHRETAGRARDEHRDRAAESDGWTVHRVSPYGFGPRLATTVNDLIDSLKQRRIAS